MSRTLEEGSFPESIPIFAIGVAISSLVIRPRGLDGLVLIPTEREEIGVLETSDEEKAVGRPEEAQQEDGTSIAGKEEVLEPAINVLGVCENGAWCAIALEMSLRGYGRTFEAALDELRGAIEAQVSFAVQQDSFDQIFIPAEPHYFKLYADMKREALKRKLLNRSQLGLPDYRVGDIPLPAPTAARFTPAVA